MSNYIANSNIPILSTGYDYNLWCKRMYEYLVLTHGSEASEFMNPNGNSTWWQPQAIKLNVISKSLQDHFIKSSSDDSISTRSTSTTPIPSDSTLFNSDPLHNPIDSELRGVDAASVVEEYGIQNLPPHIRRNPVRNNRRDMKVSWKGYSYVATQYTRRQAQVKFGALAVKAKMKEIIQLDDKEVMYPVDFFLLNKEQRKRIIRSHVIWVRDYLINQGYNIGPVTIYQDNKSTMALVKKGYSTANNTRHINIRYFFIKDRVEKQELKIEYLPTEDMIADFFTKPLQGELFKKLRNKILGITTDQTAYIMYT